MRMLTMLTAAKAAKTAVSLLTTQEKNAALRAMADALVEKLQGIRVCRLARGNWVEEWIEDGEADTFRLTGHFVNLEPEAEDTDDWATRHGMAAVTPLKLDMTHFPTLPLLKELES